MLLKGALVVLPRVRAHPYQLLIAAERLTSVVSPHRPHLAAPPVLPVLLRLAPDQPAPMDAVER